MGATNHTSNYNLSQFIGTDKPSWLNDYNGDMLAIDTGIKGAADAAALAQSTATNADSTATSAANTASALATQINTPVTGIAAVVTGHTTDITNINNTIGSTPLTTLASTLTGAIEEVKGDIPDVTGAMKLVSSGTISESYDGTNTYGQVMDSIYSQLVTLFSTLQSGEYIRITGCTPVEAAFGVLSVPDGRLFHEVPTAVRFNGITPFSAGASTIYVAEGKFASSSYVHQCGISANALNAVDSTTNAPTAGNVAYILYEKYSIL